jgi:APA family basic amino acid/polyamine antiporter
MAQLKVRGLRKTVGVPGLFATAYGNVGSSIYYALGLVAAHALGLTPLVFLFAGGLFALTAKTYAAGTDLRDQGRWGGDAPGGRGRRS